MSRGYTAKDYKFEKTGVSFRSADKCVQKIFDRAEELAKDNIRQFGDLKIIQEGAKYQGVWLETQPMGGEMYASRDIEVALNNHLIFMKYQRRDGRLPGTVRFRQIDGTAVHYDWMQGDFFTVSALRMYYLINKDKEYLEKLYKVLRDFDEYLWEYRDSDGDGCLESWCVWDSADDNSTRYIANGVHPLDNGPAWGEEPPENAGGLPFESAEYMAYSYSHRIVLAEISDILGNGEGEKWRNAAKEIQDKVREYLWDEDKKAVFDRDRRNEMMYVLTLSNLKCMYHGLFTQAMADDFIRHHLLNAEEFFTPLPLPHIAASDPLFYVNGELNNLSPDLLGKVNEIVGVEALDNSWSGAVEGLTIQRSIDALLRYGHLAEATVIGRKWLDTLYKTGKFVQQYNPMTCEACPGDDGYGSAILAAMEYIAYLYGVDYALDKLRWGCAKNGTDSTFVQTLFGSEFTLKHENGKAVAEKDGKTLFEVTEGVSVLTDIDGNIESITGMECEAVEITLSVGGTVYNAVIEPNGVYRIEKEGISCEKRIAFDLIP